MTTRGYCPVHLSRVLLAALLLSIGVRAATAQDQPPATIRSIEFTGLERTGEVFARELVDLKAGEPADAKRLDDAVARLLRTGRYLSARYRLEHADGGARVIFEMRERPVVTVIRFEGNSQFNESTLKPLVTQKLGVPIDSLAVRDGQDAILAKYREAGFSEATITYDQDLVARTGELVYRISEGQQLRIREIVFEGAKTFERRDLEKQIDTKTAWWIFRTGAFDEHQAESDAARLQSFYRDEGFLDARASYRTEFKEGGRDLRVVFSVEEGTRYAIESIEFRGATVFTDTELREVIASRVGETVKRPKVDADVRAIQTRYGQLGYIDASVGSTRVFSDTAGLVRIAFDIREGAQFRVGRVVVRGNARTRDKVVRRALNLYPPDDLFDLTEVREAEKRLGETKIFSSARVYPVGDQPGVRDVIIDVKEAEKAGDFLFGVGVTSNSGLTGNVVLDLQNFDLWNPPRTLSEFIKLRSFFGGGQRLRIEAQPGTDVSRLRLDFTEPYFLDKPVRFDFSAFLFSRGRDGYDERRIGYSSSLGKRFERGPLRGWSGEIAFGTEFVSIDDLDVFAARDIRRDKGSNILTSVKGTLVRDRTDNRFIPSSGDRLRMGYEQFGILGGDHIFGRVTAGYTRYFTLSTDLRERKHILQLRADGGAVVGDAPVFERFYAGGTGSLRGFEFRGVGERQGLDDNNIGGDYMLLGGAEYSYPLIGDNVRGLLFLDSGVVGSGGVRAAIGTGVRFTIDIFGPVPLEFNLAFPMLYDEDDDRQVFSFLIGRIF